MNSSPGLRFFPYRPAAWLLVRGADAASYLRASFPRICEKSTEGRSLTDSGSTGKER